MSDGISHLLRASGRYPLTGRGDINTYSVFAETGRTILGPRGQLAFILPTGIATDATTQDYFRDLVVRRSLVSLYDFENEEKVFPDVHHSFRFALLTLGGRKRTSERISLVFRVRQVDQIASTSYNLTPDEITLVNPNTGTCPVFNSRRDADLVIKIYRRVPALWRDGSADGNPWDLSFMRMFDMANDSYLFRTADELVSEGWRLEGNVFVRDSERMLPLYEAKMIHYFDHRLATYEGATQAQLNVGTLPRLDDGAHDDASIGPLPRYWVADAADRDSPSVTQRLGGRWDRGWMLGWRDIARSTDERTLIATVIPLAAAGHKIPLIFCDAPWPCMQANLSTYVLDYVARQKLSGTSVAFFLMKQLPLVHPKSYQADCKWDTTSLAAWITARVLELSYTAHDLGAYARDLNDGGPPFRWIPERRELMRAELDAAYFHLYGVEREDVEYIMDTFKVVRDRDEATHGEYRTKRLILECYDGMAEAKRTGKPYATPLDPPPGQGPRHPDRR